MLIRQKLLSGFACVALFVVGVGYLAVSTSERALRKSIGEQSATLAGAISAKIDRNIYHRIEQVQVYSQDIGGESELAKSNQEFEELDNVQEYIEEKDEAWKVAGKEEITPFMQDLINNELSKQIREEFELKEAYRAKYGYAVFGEIFLTNRYGVNVAQTQKTSDYYQADEEWWQRAREDGLSVTDVEYDLSTGSYSIDIGVRVDDENGDFLGVVKAVLNIAEVISIMKNIGANAKPEASGLRLLTKDGNILYSTEEYEFLESMSEDASFHLLGEGCSHDMSYFIMAGDQPGEGEKLFAHAHSKGHRDYKGLGWFFMIEHAEKRIFAPVVQLRNTLLAISFFVTVFALLSGLFISRSLSRPIMKLKHSVARVGKGELNTKIEVKSNDEIGQLATSFIEMVDNLKTTTTSLDNLNEEIAERRKAQEELQRSKEFLATVLDCMTDAISIIDAHNFGIVGCNAAFSNKVGLEERQVIGKCCYKVTHNLSVPCEPPEHPCPLAETAATGDCSVAEHVHYRGDAEKTYLEISTAPIKDENGKVIQVVHASRDVTERKEAERAIRLAYEELETAHKALKGMQTQIVQSEKLASIGQLAAGVAHEMNTPIGFVASNFQTLEDYMAKIKKLLGMYDELVKEIEGSGKTDLLNKAGIITEGRTDMKIDFILEDIQDLFDESREGLTRVTDIVQNLRDFSRIDQPGSLDEYDLNGGIEATLVVATNEIKYHADVKTEFSQVPATYCNSGQINQVLLNILVNAAQAINSQEREDRGTITIKTYATETEVVCEISDNGPGIESDKLSRVFEPFYTTKPAGKGTGLGLSVSYDIVVHKHNGKLLVDSTVGEGTKFIIELPIKETEPQSKELRANEENCFDNIDAKTSGMEERQVPELGEV